MPDWVAFSLCAATLKDFSSTTATNACKTGKAILHAYDSKCGSNITNFPLTVGTGELSEVVKQGDKLYIGISGEADKSLTNKDNLIMLKSGAKDTGNEVQLEKWIENY